MTVLAPKSSIPNSDLKPAREPNIAIIGMEGSGKTVLTTTLAKRLSIIDSRGVFLNPQGVKTLKYVEHVWHTLQSGNWPPSTPPGQMFELKWKFQVVGELECDVRLIDAAGQDLRLLFGDEQILSVESLPKHLQALAEYCRTADIILFLINLKDFVGQGNPERRTANEAAIKSAMDYLQADGRPRRVCLVLTQADLYRDLASERGGWLELAAEAVPYIFGAHIRVNQVAVHPVSAVAETHVVVDSGGTPRRVPTAGFKSEGLDPVVLWLTTQVREVKQELTKEAEAAELAANPVPPLKKSPWGKIIATVVLIAIAIFLWWGWIPGCTGPKDLGSVTSPMRQTQPSPLVTWEWGIKWGIFNDDVWVKNTSAFSLTYVRLTIKDSNGLKLVENDLETIIIRSGQTHTWSNAISLPKQKLSASLKCDQDT